MTPNQTILKSLHTAPAGQISPKVREAVLACSPNDNGKMIELFRWIYLLDECERSSFVAELVNPAFTERPEYGRRETTCTSKAA